MLLLLSGTAVGASVLSRLPYQSPIDFKVNIPPANTIILDTMENASLWSVGNGDASIENDNTFFVEGTQSLRLKTNSASNSGCMIKNVDFDLSNRYISMWLYKHDSNLNYIYLRFGDPTWSNYFNFRVGGGSRSLGWSIINLSPNDFYSTTGSPNWSDITALRISITSTRTGIVTYANFDNCRMIREDYPVMVTLRFDDGFESCFTEAYPLMARYGYRGFAAVVTSTIGNTNRMTLDNLHELQDFGWDIASHTVTHPQLATIPLDEVEYQLAESQNWLLNNGFLKGARFFVAPTNSMNQDTIDLAKKYYITCPQFYTDWGFDFNFYPFEGYRDTLFCPGGEDAGIYYDTPWNWAIMKSYIDTAVANHNWLILTVHKMDVDTFEILTDYLYDNSIEVVTFSDVFDRLSDFKTRLTNSGTTTLLNGQTSRVVSHNCSFTPNAGDISVHPVEALGSASYWFVDTITSAQFTIHVNTDPSQDVDFAWSVACH